MYSSTGLTIYVASDSIDSDLVIPDGVTVIADYAFNYNNTLESITLPSSITYIGDQALYCWGLETIYFEGTEEEWDAVTLGSYAFLVTVTCLGIDTEEEEETSTSILTLSLEGLEAEEDGTYVAQVGDTATLSISIDADIASYSYEISGDCEISDTEITFTTAGTVTIIAYCEDEEGNTYTETITVTVE